jgi:hypothetical protein
LAVSGERGSSEPFCQNPPGVGRPQRGAGRAIPQEERDLFIAASNGHLLFDNLSDLPHWISDVYAALKRRSCGPPAYTDQDGILFQAAAPPF